ncbi:MAG: NAD(P)/FAD-dependent oxidoreductase [Candidatus Thermoplasmatota archaeon]|nr:NAD(P)/FAD-dependent oxidoreductase [Candidatus Thermoplasmatota archaeon]
MRYDVAIIGGGPAGSMTARALAKEGYSVAVLEEHAEIGKLVSCAGLVTERVVKMAGTSDGVVVNKIKGADVYSPGKKEIRIGGNKIHALVIDREKFDKEMAEMAIAEGAEYRCRWKASDAYIKNGEIIVKGKEEVKCKYLVGADGARSDVAKWFNFPEPKEYIYAMQATVPYKMQNESVKVFFGNNVAPGFFAWVIPEEKKARIGLGVRKGYKLKKYFFKFLEMVEIGKTREGEINAGIIPVGLRNTFSSENVSLVGDAAAQVKATSGGGLYPGLLAAKILEKAIQKFLEGNGTYQYEREYMKDFGKELKKSMAMRKFFLRADDKKIDAIFDSLNDDVIRTINEYGDIDYPSIAAKELIKRHPKLLKFLFLPF